MQLYNTMTRRKENFEPRHAGKVGMYACGITAYDLSHIGHARSAVVFDVLNRYLRHLGYDVTFVRNFTDVDDKIIARANREGKTCTEIAETYIAAFHEDMDRLNVRRADIEPRATEYIGEMQTLIQTLIDGGHAYPVPSGDVYFRVRSFPGYGKLSGRDVDDLRSGARIAIGEEKEDPLDFALWKAAKPGEPFWESPWGKGRPGWHLECPAMSKKNLDLPLDIHGGGQDLIFPHHENEIAQSEASTGKELARFWVHNGFVQINSEKMSKSLNNFKTIRDILEHRQPETLRFFLLGKHYRSPIDFSFEGLDEAERALKRVYECLRDTHVASLRESWKKGETPASVLDEFYWLNKHDPNYSLCRASVNRGEDAHTDKKFALDKASAMALSKLFLTPEKDLEDKKISEVLPESFWSTNFWLYWQTMFAFQRWSSALEMKRYLCRYVHHIDGLPDFSALRFTKYNQYESMILPLVKYLESHGVRIEYGMDVKNVVIEKHGDKRVAKAIVYVKDGQEQTLDLIEDDLVFITNGCCTDTSCYGDQTHAPDLSHLKNGCGESWDLWKAIAAQAVHGEFGNPEVFCSDIDATNWMSATVATADEEIIQHIINVCKRDPRAGKVTTGGIVTVKDSTDNWYLSWTINRQPQFHSQDKNMVLIWLYSLNTNKEGNYVKKAMRDCTGEEVCQEWLYHIGIPEEKIASLAKNACNTTTCFMPYINAFFQPRKEIDRPRVVPEGAVNFAFIGQFAETPRDTIFTTEYSMRTGMESVYTLLDIDRGVPEVWGSKYDVRELLRACYYAIDKKPLTDEELSFVEKKLLKIVLKKVKGTDIEILLKNSGLIE